MAIIDPFQKHGVRPLPSPTYSGETAGVTLVFPKVLEAKAMGMLQDVESMVDHLRHLGRLVPVHVAFGEMQPKACVANCE